MKIKAEIKIGFLVLLSLIVLIWGINFLKGKNFFLNSSNYYGKYSFVEGLNEGCPIYYKGFKIGSVSKIEFNPQDQKEFVVTFHITKKPIITNKTIAQLYSVDLLGTKAIQFINGADVMEEGAIDLYPGDFLKTSIMGDLKDQVSTEVLPLKDKVENLIITLDSVMTNIGRVFTWENKNNLNQSIISFHRTVISLEESMALINMTLKKGGNLGDSFQNLEEITAALVSQTNNLNSIMSNLKEFSIQLNDLELAEIVLKVDSTIYNINHLLEKSTSSEGSLGMLMADKTLYLNLTDASANLDRLLMDVRHNPDRYVNFSAVNIGRKVYLTPDAQSAENKGIAFKVKITESDTPIYEVKNKIVLNDKTVFEDNDGKKYIYTVGETHSYNEALNKLDKLYLDYPSSSIIALENGTPIKLSKAIKKVKK
jgi:phospholipid/cholesterol/gamma-HCH transport system substrate-binding protein